MDRPFLEIKRMLFSYAGARRVDESSQAGGLGEIQLMGQAALASFYRLLLSGRLERLAESGGSLVVLAGSGNNGGDGYALLYHLIGSDPAWAERARVYRTAEPRSEAARFYATEIAAAGVPVLAGEDFAAASAQPQDLIVEALLGTGQTDAPRGAAGAMLAQLGRLRARPNAPYLLALDVPAGLRENESTRFSGPGPARGRADEASALPAPDEIHSYGVDKAALRLNSDLAAHSQIRVLPMGFQPSALRSAAAAESAPVFAWNTTFKADDFRKGPLSHKYENGHGLCLGGSRGMEGAALLAGASFFAAGGGILHIVTQSEESRQLMTAAHPTFMCRPATEFESPDLNPPAILIGPGLAPDDLAQMRPALLAWLERLAGSPAPPFAVLDAGALDLIRDEAYPAGLRHRTVITPHAGEWKRLGGPAIAGRLDGLQAAAEFGRRELGCFVLVKDAISCLIEPADPAGDDDGTSDSQAGGRIFVFARPRPALGVAGSGDVLAGILLARLARRPTAARSESLSAKIQAAVSLHSRAAAFRVHPLSEEFPELIREVLNTGTPNGAQDGITR